MGVFEELRSTHQIPHRDGGTFAFAVGFLIILFGDDAFNALPPKVACEQAVVDGFGSTRIGSTRTRMRT